MPEVYMEVEFPEKGKYVVYSPSTIIREYFKKGDSMPIEAFEKTVIQALKKASKRVYEKYGYECTSAMGEIERIKATVSQSTDKNKIVKILFI